MKKLKILFIMIVLLSSFSLILPTLSYAVDLDPNTYTPSDEGIDDDTVAKYAGPIYNILFGIAIIVSVITLMIIGLKFIVGSAQEKAEYKQHLVPVVIGICVIAFLFTILGALSSLSGSIEDKARQEQEFIGPKQIDQPKKTDDSGFIGPKKLDIQ